MAARKNWRFSRKPRLGAAVFAAGITAALLWTFTESPKLSSENQQRVTVWLPPPNLRIQAVPPAQREVARLPEVPMAPRKLNPGRPTRTPPLKAAAPEPTVPAETVAAPSTAYVQSPPALNLTLPPSALGRNSVRSMAARSGAYVGDEHPSDQAKLAQSISRSGKPDCLAPNEHGSLLSIFKIAYDAATHKCK
jgi:type IV secretory pathway VirB10-like protein